MGSIGSFVIRVICQLRTVVISVIIKHYEDKGEVYIGY